MDRTFRPSRRAGAIRIPGSKSQTIRSYLLALEAHGVSIIQGALESSDTLACRKLCEALGATFTSTAQGLSIDSTHAFEHLPDIITVDCMNSGTSLYLSAGLLAATGKKVTLTGDGQLCKRPIAPLLSAYEKLGATVERLNGDTPPCTIQGPLHGGCCSIACPTSQYLSSLLLACPLAEGNSEIDIPLLYEKPYVSLTLGWLDAQHIRYSINSDLSHVSVPGGQHYHPFQATIPGDYSSATFFFCLAAICGTSITVEGLRPDDPQGDKKVLDILSAMGCKVSFSPDSVTVTGPSELKGGSFDLNDIPDALPVLSATACLAAEDVSFTNVSQARIKETDRIACMHEELAKLGADITESPDGMTIHAGRKLHGGTVDGHGDHRIIMALSTLSAVVPGEVTIHGIDAVDVTFPTFFTLMDTLGGNR